MNSASSASDNLQFFPGMKIILYSFTCAKAITKYLS
jgi:hypothetical protein